MKGIRLLSLFYIVGFGLISLFSLAGCRSTVKYVEMERLDQGMAGGNKGYLFGVPPKEERPAPSKTRGVIEMEVELSPIMPHKKYKTEKPEKVSYQELKRGNRGYLAEGKQETPQASLKTPFAATYTVKKGDSLSKIAKHFYGNPNKWRKIYEANKSNIKDPNKLKVGLVLEIPQD